MKKVLGIIILVVGLFLAVGSGVMAADPPDLEVDIGISGEDVEVNVDVNADTSTVNVDGGDNSDYNINGSNLQDIVAPRGGNTLNEWVHQNVSALWEYAQQSNMQLALVSDALAYKIQNDEAYFSGMQDGMGDLNYRVISLEEITQNLDYTSSQMETRLLALENGYKDLQAENTLLKSRIAYLEAQQYLSYLGKEIAGSFVKAIVGTVFSPLSWL